MGLPSVVDGKMHYDLDPEAVRRVPDPVRHRAGRPGRRRVLRLDARAHPPAGGRGQGPDAGRPATRPEPGATSMFSFVPFHQDASFLIIGERTNANGSRKFRDTMLAGRLGQLRQDRPRPGEGGRPRPRRLRRLRGPRRHARHGRAGQPLRHPGHRAAGARLHRAPGASRPGSSASAAGPSSTPPTSRTARPRAAASTGCAAWPASTARPSSACSSTRRARPATSSGRCGSPTASTTWPPPATAWRPSDLIFDALTFPLSTGDDDLRRDAMRHDRGDPAHQGRAARRVHDARRVERELRPVARGPPRPQLGVPPRVRGGRARLGDRARGPHHAAQQDPRGPAQGVPRPGLRPARRGRRATTRWPSCSTSSPTSRWPRPRRRTASGWAVEERLKHRIIDGDRDGLTGELDEAMAGGLPAARHHQRRAARPA